jgi:dTDP-glucose 4,6-dehydratase
MKKVLITGGAGFIGSNFVHYLQDVSSKQSQELEIVVLDLLTYAGNLNNLKGLASPEKVRFVQGDVRDFTLVNDLVREVDTVIHLAAESHVDRSITDPAVFIDTNIKGTFNILEAAKKFRKRVVLVSTDEVYGSLDTGKANEDFQINPSSPYSASKASADLLAIAFHRTFGLDVVITRCSNNYGPRQYPEKLIPLTIKKILLKQNIPVYGDGKNVRDWIHVDDHCSGLYLAMTFGKPGRIYNFGDVDKIANITIVEQLLTIMNESTDLIEFVDDRLGHDYRYAIDASRARNELGWVPQKNLLRDLPRVVDSYKKTEPKP